MREDEHGQRLCEWNVFSVQRLAHIFTCADCCVEFSSTLFSSSPDNRATYTRWDGSNLTAGITASKRSPSTFGASPLRLRSRTGLVFRAEVVSIFRSVSWIHCRTLQCPGCPYGGLDFSQGLFEFFASTAEGIIYGNWEFGSGPPVSSRAEPPPTPTPTPTPTMAAPSSTSSSRATSHSSSAASSASTTESMSAGASAADSQASGSVLAVPGRIAQVNAVVVALGNLVVRE